MEYFTDLIERSYNYYTKDKEAEIAQYYFESQAKSDYLKLDFYSELISAIDSLIDKINLKAINLKNELSMLSEKDLDNYYYNLNEEKTYKENQLNDIQRWYDDSGIDYTLEKPNPNPVKSKSDLIYLKEEATRAKNAKNIKELNTATSDLLVENEVLGTPFDIEKMIKDAFAFTRKEDPRNKKIALTEDDFNNLVKWVTYYFENGYEVPDINNSITGNGIKVTHIRYTFKILFDDFKEEMSKRGNLKQNMRKRKNLSALASKCFLQLKHDPIDAISKTKEPKNYVDYKKNR